MSLRQPLSHDQAEELAGLYALDALEPDEAEAVRAHLATCDLPHPFLDGAREAAPALLETVEPVDAPVELRSQVLAAVAATEQPPADVPAAAGVPALAAVPAHRPMAVAVPAPEPKPRRSWSDWWRPAFAVAAVLLIVALAASNLLLLQRANDANTQADTLRAALAAVANPNSQVAVLKGTGPAVSAVGFAAFPPNQAGYMVLEDVPQVPAGKTYQAWFLVGSQPYSAGLVSVDTNGTAVVGGMNLQPGTDTVALTVENAGGVAAPTGAPVIAGPINTRGG